MKLSTSSTCDRIEAASFPILIIPFHGVPMAFKVRELTQAQARACGEFSLIETAADRIGTKRLRMRDIIAYSEVQYKIIKASLIDPTYDTIMERLGKHVDAEKSKNRLDELKKLLEQTRIGPQRRALEEEIDSYRIWINLILPEDFIGYVIAYAMGINKSDIKQVSEDLLLEAAILAERGHKRPSEIICKDGWWSPFMEADVDKRAYTILDEKRKTLVRKGK